MSDNNKAREIRDLFTGVDKKTSYYNFKVGKIINGNLMSLYAALDNIITCKETGHVLMRFCVKGHFIDIMFKPEDIVVCTSIIDKDEPISVDSLEEGLKLISNTADKKDI